MVATWTRVEKTVRILTGQARADGGLTYYGGQGNEENHMNSGYMLEVEVIGVDSRLNMGRSEEKRGVKSDL